MKNIFLLFAILSCSAIGWGQTSKVKILDLSVLPFFNTDTISHSVLHHSDSTILTVSFKVSDASASSKVHIFLGAAKDSFDVRKAEALFIQSDTSYYLSFNGEKNKIVKYHSMIVITISNTEMQQWQYLTLFVEDKQGQTSRRLYFRKNN